MSFAIEHSFAESPELEVVFKLDDVRASNGDVPARWSRVYEFAVAEEVPVSMGVITDSLDREAPRYFASLQEWEASGYVELWNHGYNHRRWEKDGKKVTEFSGPDAATQESTLRKGQELGEEKLGIVFCSFGAPFNAVDGGTVTALENVPELTVWLYGRGDIPKGVVNLKRNPKVNLEPSVGTVSFEKFRAAFESHPIPSPLVLQGHPGGWDDEDFAEFIQVVEYLKSQGVTFRLPRDFVAAPK